MPHGPAVISFVRPSSVGLNSRALLRKSKYSEVGPVGATAGNLARRNRANKSSPKRHTNTITRIFTCSVRSTVNCIAWVGLISPTTATHAQPWCCAVAGCSGMLNPMISGFQVSFGFGSQGNPFTPGFRQEAVENRLCLSIRIDASGSTAEKPNDVRSSRSIASNIGFRRTSPDETFSGSTRHPTSAATTVIASMYRIVSIQRSNLYWTCGAFLTKRHRRCRRIPVLPNFPL